MMIVILIVTKPREEKKRTNHSLWPWNPSGFNFLTAMTNPDPGFAAERVCSSIHPLKTYPNPPSPRRLSGLKFLVAFFNSLNEKALTCGDDRISASDLGVGRLSPLLFPLLYEVMLMFDGTDEQLVLLGYLDASKPHDHIPLINLLDHLINITRIKSIFIYTHYLFQLINVIYWFTSTQIYDTRSHQLSSRMLSIDSKTQ